MYLQVSKCSNEIIRYRRPSQAIQAAVTEYYRLDGLKQRKLIPQFWRLARPRSRPQQLQCLVKAHFLVHRQLCPHRVEGLRGTLQVSFIRGLISSMRAQTLRLHHFPKAPPSNSITLGVRIQHLSFGGT